MPRQLESAVAVPAFEVGQWVDRDAVDVDLEVEMAADRDRVAGLADSADPLALPDPLALANRRRAGQVGVEIATPLAFAVNQQVVAVEDRVVAGPENAAVADGDQLGLAGGDDVEALVGAAAVTAGAEFADRAADPVWALDREDVTVIGNAADGTGDASRGRNGQGEEKGESEKDRALQWCSMTRSTMLYSTASSALMK
jgi:hypothetical protein